MKEVKKEFCWFSITEYEKEEDIFCDDQSRLELLPGYVTDCILSTLILIGHAITSYNE